MTDLFYSGGSLPMSILSIIALAALLIAAKKGLDLFVKSDPPPGEAHALMVNLVLQLGLLAFFLGVLAQAIGLIQMFQAIEGAGDVSPAMIMGGLKVSMIAPVYGLIILILAFVAWSALKYRNESR